MKKLLAIALSPVLLGGCASIFGHHAVLDLRPGLSAHEVQAAAASLQEGRQELDRGEIASAIVSFRIAALDQVSIAAAHNGLGVAYARLGRNDLAERYFQQAASEDPAEPKYASNLARLEMTREAALARADTVPAPSLASADQPNAGNLPQEPTAPDRTFRIGSSNFTVSQVNDQYAVSRVSAREISIRTRPAVAIATSADGRRRNPNFAVALSAPRVAYPVRLAINASYPIRIALPAAHDLSDRER